ncbi:MAG: C39 family peptidase [Candidatus Pacebacteria bacterium]|nr:C39 family peptidase [Candidatus Paceibacterota bacterium]
MIKLKLNNKIFIQLLLVVFLITFFIPQSLFAKYYGGELNGKILLQVEENGEAWYVYPEDGHRYFLGRPIDAFSVMKNLSLGAKHSFIANTEVFPLRLAGMILLDVERNGEAYYIHPNKLTKYYLNRPADAFSLMKELGLGITNSDLNFIPIADINTVDSNKNLNISSYIDNVPFTSQAPFFDWQDQRQQDGCEESSALMTIRWARGQSLTKQEALESILGASNYLLKKYGEYRDISTQDAVAWIFKDYFNYDKVEVRYDVNVEDIIYELNQGNLVIAPMNGQTMNNPYFTPPGPTRHMIVIRGYDKDKDVFITNDPGTRYGENYEYNSQVLYNSIRDYPTGYHELIEKVAKNIIVVWK